MCSLCNGGARVQKNAEKRTGRYYKHRPVAVRSDSMIQTRLFTFTFLWRYHHIKCVHDKRIQLHVARA